MAKGQTTKRMIGVGALGQNNPTIPKAGQVPAPSTPPSISNPSSLTPGTTTPKATVPSTPTVTPTVQSNNDQQFGAQYDVLNGPSKMPKATVPTTPTVPTVAPQPEQKQNGIPNFSESVKDPANFLGSGLDVNGFINLTPEEQKRYVDASLASEEEKKAVYDQVKYAEENKRQQEYIAQQESISRKTTELSNENETLRSNAILREEQQNLDNLKQNIGFLGSGGRPVKSQGMLDSYSRTLSEANTTFNEIQMLHKNAKEMRELGIEFDGNAYTEKVRLLNKDLTDKVDSVILQAINGFTAEQMAGAVDSPKKLYDLQQKYLDSIDTSVAGLTNRSIQSLTNLQTQMADRIKQVNDELKVKREEDALKLKNSNTVNMDMSKVQGHYVDGNGKALVGADGGIIKYQPEMPPPVYDKDQGVLVSYIPDEFGRPTPVVKQLMPASADYQMNLQLKKMQLLKMQAELTDYGLTTDTSNTTVPSIINDPASIVAYSQKERGKTLLQCGQLVNDYIKSVTGTKGTLGDYFVDKVAGINAIGRSNVPMVGGIFAQDIGKNGHTGIVTAVNADGSIQVLEANAEGSDAGGVPKTTTYSANSVANMVFSVPPQEKINFTDAQVAQFKKYDGNTIPEEYKTQAQKNRFLADFNKWSQQNPKFLNKDERAEVNKVIDNLAQDPSYKAYETIKSKEMAFQEIVTDLKNSAATAQDKQALISDFAKALDPTSVVREGEYALAGKYSQSKLAAYKQEAYNYLNAGGPLSDEAALLLAQGLERQYKVIGKAHDEAIDNKLKGLKYILDKDVSIDALQTSYSKSKALDLATSSIDAALSLMPVVPGAKKNDPLGIR